MEDHLHDQRMQIGKMYQHEVPPAIVTTAGNNTRPHKLPTSANSDKKSHKCSTNEQNEKCVKVNASQITAGSRQKHICDRLSGCSDDKTDEKRDHNLRQVYVGEHTFANVDHEEDDDDTDVVIKKIRNGCEKSFLERKQSENLLCDQIESIHLGPMLTSDDLLKENTPNVAMKNTKDVSSVGSSLASTFSPTTTTTTTSNISSSSTSSSVIFLAGQSTTNLTHINQSQHECKEYPCGAHKLDTCSPLSSQEIVGATRGKSIAQCITNTNKDAIHDSTTGIATTNQTTFNIACQSPLISVLPLHACNTYNHYHHHHHHHNKYQHHHNKTEQSEHFANELTNALSSRLLFQLTNSSYCTNSASSMSSQSRRQSSFLKSQSLEIFQDPPSILYNEHDDEHIFFQLPEINEDELHQNYQQHDQPRSQQRNEDDEEIDLMTNIKRPYQSSNITDRSSGETMMVTRSLSLSSSSSSSQKTGVALKAQSLESRPIYPNVPYSPYASPYSSPRSNRRRPPLRESRRISIEQSGSFLQLNQYKLMDQIGQVSLST